MTDSAPRVEEGRRGPFHKGWLRVAASALLITLILTRIELETVLAAAAGARVSLLVAVALAPFAATVIVVVRWRLLLEVEGKHFAPRFLYASYLVAGAVRQFLPSTIGGDMFRAFDTWRAGAGRRVALSAVLTERIVGVFALLIIGTVAAGVANPVSARFPYLFPIFTILTAIVAAVCCLLFIPAPSFLAGGRARSKVRGRVASFLDDVLLVARTYAGRVGVVARVLGWSFAMQFAAIGYYWLIALALDLPLGYGQLLQIVPVATLVMMLPITLNGVGLREGVFVVLLGAYGIDAGVAVAFAWIEFASNLLMAAAGAIVLMIRSAPGERMGRLGAVARWAAESEEAA